MAVPVGAAAMRTGGAEAGRTVAELRLAAYATCLAVAFGLYLAIHGREHGAAFWVAGCLLCAALGWGSLLQFRAAPGSEGRSEPWLRRVAAAATAVALSVPFGLVALQGGTVEAMRPLWPQMLVLLFASRVLGAASDARFAAFWQTPTRSGGAVQIQSELAAVALGGFATLLFYQMLALSGVKAPFGTTLSGVLLGAVNGESTIHRAIVFLFFVILAHLFDGAWRHRRDRQALAALQAAAAGRLRDPATFIAETCRGFGPTRTALLVGDAVASGSGAEMGVASLAFETFRTASRRFVRGLVTLLPLLGFLGTVVGLATAMGALPLDGAAGGRVDLTASLAGLALKFETTMLGLVTSMIAALLLSALERSEAEHAAACTLFADTLRARDAA